MNYMIRGNFGRQMYWSGKWDLMGFVIKDEWKPNLKQASWLHSYNLAKVIMDQYPDYDCTIFDENEVVVQQIMEL